jgi:aminoglycoside 6'-N-acetyltransferase
MQIIKDEITICPMKDKMDDYKLLEKWRTNEEVLKFYGGRDYPYFLERIIEIYQPRIWGEELLNPCIFSYQDIAIGYLQYYALNDLTELDREMYCLEATANVYGIDLFIGEPNYWNRGIGTKVLSVIVDYIFAELPAIKIVIDPDVRNVRAIRCYEKCGFVKVKLLPAYQIHEGKYQDCWLMAMEKRK